MKLKFLLILVISTLSLSAFAKKTAVLQDLDSLGSNDEIAKRSQAIDAENKIRVVQNRTVDRSMRFELSVGYDFEAGGDPYLNSNSIGIQGDFHLSNKISLGVRYYDTSSRLSPEGDRVLTAYNNGTSTIRPDVDYVLSSTLGVLTFYPLYGKLNFFNLGVTQFDTYLLVGYGQTTLKTGNTPLWTAGGGIAFWLSQHVTSRIEARYISYQDQIYTGSRTEGVMAFSGSLGFLL